MEIVEYVANSWDLIEGQPNLFLAVAIIVATAVTFYWRHHFSGQLNTLRERLALKDERLSDYQAKLDGASPDEAKARIDALEERVQSLAEEIAPRRLNDEQMKSITTLAASSLGHISVVHDMSCPEGGRLSVAFQRAFKEAGWEVSGGIVGGLCNPPSEGILLTTQDVETESGRAAIAALESTGIPFEHRTSLRSPSGPKEAQIDAELLITLPGFSTSSFRFGS